MRDVRTITCSPKTKTEWDSLKRQLAAALDRPLRDPELVEMLLVLGRLHIGEMERLAVGKISGK